MARRSMVNDVELKSAVESAEDIGFALDDLTDRIRTNIGWDDDVSAPIRSALAFAGLARAAASLSQVMLTKLASDADSAALIAKLSAERSK